MPVDGGRCVDAAEDCIRLVKAVSAFLLGNVAVGMSIRARNNLNQELSEVIQDHMGIVRFVGTMYTSTFLCMWVVNVFCLLYSFLGTACIREKIWRERAGESNKERAIQLCVGPCCATVLQTALFATLALQIGVSYIYLLVACVMAFLNSICHAGERFISMFQGTVNEYNAGHPMHDSWNPMNWFITLKMEQFCYGTRGLDEASKTCFWACVLTTVSQVLMMIVISEEKGRIEATMNEDYGITQGKKVAPKNDDASSSSSDSDYEADPLVKFRKKRSPPRGAGRNYKLPGGYQPGAKGHR